MLSRAAARGAGGTATVGLPLKHGGWPRVLREARPGT